MRAPEGETGARGEAFVAGRVVRYVAPARLSAPETFEVTYIAANTRATPRRAGSRSRSSPTDAPNRVPEPPLLEGRVTSGGEVTMKLPGTGVDPDGDAVTLVGLASAPQLGRVTRHRRHLDPVPGLPGRGTGPRSSSTCSPTRAAAAPPGRCGWPSRRRPARSRRWRCRT